MADLRHHLPVPLASRILLRGFELGVNFWDTADGYKTHPVAEALRQVPRDQVVINTKTRARTAPKRRRTWNASCASWAPATSTPC